MLLQVGSLLLIDNCISCPQAPQGLSSVCLSHRQQGIGGIHHQLGCCC
jgi:hypothetical protein